MAKAGHEAGLAGYELVNLHGQAGHKARLAGYELVNQLVPSACLSWQLVNQLPAVSKHSLSWSKPCRAGSCSELVSQFQKPSMSRFQPHATTASRQTVTDGTVTQVLRECTGERTVKEESRPVFCAAQSLSAGRSPLLKEKINYEHRYNPDDDA